MTPEPTAPAPLVGRDLELATLAAAVADVRAGNRRVVLVEGGPGMGKTALLRAALSHERCTLVWASGDEHEVDIDLGVIDQLVRDAPLDAAAADDVRSTLAGGDPLRAGASLVGLLDGLHIDPSTPLVAVVDDAHWADTSSLRALTFAARRLRRDPVLLCVVIRSGATNLPDGLVGLTEHEGLTIRLPPLSRTAVQQLASAELRTRISGQAATRLLDHTGGSPLHLNALLQELTPAMLTSGDELPAPRSFGTLVLSKLGGAPPYTEALVAAVAVLGDPVGLSIAARLADVVEPFAPLDHAVGHGLLEVVSGRNRGPLQVAIPHPLVRAAVLGDLAPGRLADLHRRAGTLLEGLAALRHRLLGALGPDEGLWAEALDAARSEAQRGANGSAAALYRDGASVAPTEEARERALIEALDQLLLAGRLDDAVALRHVLDEAEPSARSSYVAGRLAYVVGPRRATEAKLHDAWSRLTTEVGEEELRSAPAEVRELAGRIAAMLATVKVDRGDGAAAIGWCDRALELAPEQAALASTAHMLASAHALTGDMVGGLARLDEACAERTIHPSASGLEVADVRSARGLLRLWTHDLDGAVEDLSASLTTAGALGSFVARETTRSYLAEAHYRRGSWDEAVLLGQLASSVVDDSDHAWMAVLPHASVARPLAARGEDSALEHLRAAQAAAEAIGVGVMLGLARLAAIEVAACARDHDTALELGELVLAGRGAADERIVPWRANLVESLVARGQHDVAAELRDQLAEHPQPTALTRTDAARASVVLGEAHGQPAAVDAAAEAGLGLDPGAVGPYPRARLELVVGRAWRHRGERRKAAALLEQARQRFEALAARPWLTQVEHELTASGLKPARRSISASAELTPQEGAVARLVGKGMTNREVAAELVVSAKTVEHHLSRIYAKLGVRSRTELAARLSQS